MDYRNWVKENSSTLNQQEKRFLYLLSLCDYVLPNYAYFAKKNQWGSLTVLENCLLTIENIIIGSPVNKELINQQISLVNDNTPDLDDFEDDSSSYALDTCVVFEESLIYLLDQDYENLLNASVRVLDTVDLFIQELRKYEPSDPIFEEKIISDYYFGQEIKRQTKIINYILKINKISKPHIINIKNINREYGFLPLEFVC